MAVENVLVLVLKITEAEYARKYKKGQLYMGHNGWDNEDGNENAEAISTNIILKEFNIKLPE